MKNRIPMIEGRILEKARDQLLPISQTNSKEYKLA